MDELSTEKEQLKQIKQWLQENGLSLVMGVVLGLGGVYGWRWWQDYRITESEKVSAQLAEAVDKIDQQQYQAGVTLAQTIVDEKGGAMYGEMARLVIASAQVKQGMTEEAVQALRVIAENEASIFQHTARLRLARIYLAQSEYDQARQLIPAQLPPAYAQRYEELRGDIAFYSGDPQQAREAYQQSIAKASPADDLEFLQMKLDDLPANKD